MIKLKPCPFCGGEAVLFVHPEGGVSVVCTRCDAKSKTRVDSNAFTRPTNAIKSVVEAWNRRIDDDLMERMQDDGR